MKSEKGKWLAEYILIVTLILIAVIATNTGLRGIALLLSDSEIWLWIVNVFVGVGTILVSWMPTLIVIISIILLSVFFYRRRH